MLFAASHRAWCYSQWGRLTWINAAVKAVISECCGFVGALIGTAQPNTLSRTMPHSANRARSVSHLSFESAKWQIWPLPMFVRPMLIWSLFVLARLPRSHYAEKRTPLLMWLTGKTPQGARGWSHHHPDYDHHHDHHDHNQQQHSFYHCLHLISKLCWQSSAQERNANPSSEHSSKLQFLHWIRLDCGTTY